jgi:hypothetical protein
MISVARSDECCRPIRSFRANALAPGAPVPGDLDFGQTACRHWIRFEQARNLLGQAPASVTNALASK